MPDLWVSDRRELGASERHVGRLLVGATKFVEIAQISRCACASEKIVVALGADVSISSRSGRLVGYEIKMLDRDGGDGEGFAKKRFDVKAGLIDNGIVIEEAAENKV